MVHADLIYGLQLTRRQLFALYRDQIDDNDIAHVEEFILGMDARDYITGISINGTNQVTATYPLDEILVNDRPNDEFAILIGVKIRSSLTDRSDFMAVPDEATIGDAKAKMVDFLAVNPKLNHIPIRYYIYVDSDR